MRIVFAVLMGAAILIVVWSVVRNFSGDVGPSERRPAKAIPLDVRIVFWCETCGTEVLLVRQGSDAAPRHCGEPMIRREEILTE